MRSLLSSNIEINSPRTDQAIEGFKSRKRLFSDGSINGRSISSLPPKKRKVEGENAYVYPEQKEIRCVNDGKPALDGSDVKPGDKSPRKKPAPRLTGRIASQGDKTSVDLTRSIRVKLIRILDEDIFCKANLIIKHVISLLRTNTEPCPDEAYRNYIEKLANEDPEDVAFIVWDQLIQPFMSDRAVPLEMKFQDGEMISRFDLVNSWESIRAEL